MHIYANISYPLSTGRRHCQRRRHRTTSAHSTPSLAAFEKLERRRKSYQHLRARTSRETTANNTVDVFCQKVSTCGIMKMASAWVLMGVVLLALVSTATAAVEDSKDGVKSLSSTRTNLRATAQERKINLHNAAKIEEPEASENAVGPAESDTSVPSAASSDAPNSDASSSLPPTMIQLADKDDDDERDDGDDAALEDDAKASSMVSLQENGDGDEEEDEGEDTASLLEIQNSSQQFSDEEKEGDVAGDEDDTEVDFGTEGEGAEASEGAENA